ncbi:MAG TPA: FKBP-type peptidyl-prolyl cis-trans isomerase [Gemmatimonadota bacterium]|nr:FKBP-type peptidyl-prolyl cis-trans isomerase [Gemmatimonadota bacterium]
MTAAALAFLLLGCASEDTTPEPDPEPLTTEEATPPEQATTSMSDPSTTTYAPELDVRLERMTRTESGLYYEVVKEGAGATVAPGQTAVVHYTGWLPNGTQFDSSRGREPFSFPVGAGQVIAGWDQGVAGMAVGEQRLLVIPPDLAYGATGAGGVIPPDATLVFEVELLEIR